MTARVLKLFQRLLVLVVIIAMASPLAACGRKGSPDRPEDSEYPRSYPSE